MRRNDQTKSVTKWIDLVIMLFVWWLNQINSNRNITLLGRRRHIMTLLFSPILGFWWVFWTFFTASQCIRETKTTRSGPFTSACGLTTTAIEGVRLGHIDCHTERAKERRQWRRTQRCRFGVRPVWLTSPTQTSVRIWFGIASRSLTRLKQYLARGYTSPSPSGPMASLRRPVSSSLFCFQISDLGFSFLVWLLICLFKTSSVYRC